MGKDVKSMVDTGVGKAKEAVGAVTNDDDLRREGRMDQDKAALKDAGHDAKQAAKEAADSITDAAKDATDAVKDGLRR